MGLILIRGLPGSGKSTIAKNLIGYYMHRETDMYWINTSTGAYEFVPERIKDAHKWCQDETEKLLSAGFSVVVSNTFTTKWEMQPYFDIAYRYNIVPQVILCQGQWDNEHNVPQDVLDKMKSRFEFDIGELYA